MTKKKVAFICVHNSCRSQIAEALGKHLRGEEFDFYSAGTETKPQINQDAVRMMKQIYGIDMKETQYSKTFDKIPAPDIAISMGCDVGCPYIGRAFDDNWGLQDPTGQSDEVFILSYLIPTQHNSLTLIGFLLRHNGLYGFGCELLFFKHLSHTDCLVVGRGAVVQVDFIYQITLAILVKKRNLNGRSHFHSALVHKVKQFGDKIGQANISANLLTTFSNFISESFISPQLRHHWCRSPAATKNWVRRTVIAENKSDAISA